MDPVLLARIQFVMLILALIGMPLVLGYTAFIYRRFWGPEPPGPEGGY